MNILSLFDGMSCGQLALQRAGIIYDNYYSSEIDKFAIKTTQYHFPNTIQIGNIQGVVGKGMNIDLLIGGSPCQGFSIAGKQLNFKDDRSKLFFEYVRLLHEVKPRWFLLENVKMKKEYELKINNLLGVRPLRFNSSWVSAQQRERLYWTNIPVTTIPKDKGIFLSDIIENGEVDRDKSYGIDSNYYKGGKKTEVPLNQSQRRNMVRQVSEVKEFGGQPHQQNRVYDTNGKCPALLAQISSGTHSILQRPRGYNKGGEKSKDGKVPPITSSSWEHNNHLISPSEKRKLTVKECCRLQTVPDDYFNGIVSDRQAYRMLGNGWTVDIISHILSHIP